MGRPALFWIPVQLSVDLAPSLAPSLGFELTHSVTSCHKQMSGNRASSSRLPSTRRLPVSPSPRPCPPAYRHFLYLLLQKRASHPSVPPSYHPFCQRTHDILHPSNLNFNTTIGLLIPLYGVELDYSLQLWHWANYFTASRLYFLLVL